MSMQADQMRRKFLEDVVRQQPNDPFARYGLAMELAKCDPGAAWTHFSHLLTHHPDYAPTYYQAGTFLVKQGRTDEARKVLSDGVEVTRKQGKQHAQSELQAALDDLGA